jgi:hypothetical protein
MLALVLAIATPAGLPNYTHPTDPAEREMAAARVLEVYAAIDQATPDPTLRAELRRVCRRESACNWIGAVTWHAGDASGGRARWRAAVARGWIDPETCPDHALGKAARWTSYGPFGLAAAWAVPLLGSCVGPEALDDPRTAARAVVAWVDRLCRRQGACTCEDRTRWWVGPGRWETRSRWSQLASVERQCGAVPWWRWAGAVAVDGWRALGQAAASNRVAASAW